MPFGYRHVVMLLGFAGLSLCYILRIAPGIIIISMVQNTKLKNNLHYDAPKFETEVGGKKFNWTTIEENAILSSFFYAYFAMQLPAGFMVQHTGGKWTFAIGVSLCGLISICIPKLVEFGGFTSFLILRLLQGLSQGLCYPSVHRVAGSWFPPKEYATLSGIMHSGYIFGTVIALTCSGYLIRANQLGGWPFPFYVWGTLVFVWLPAWVIFVSESPRTHSFISASEKQYIEASLQSVDHLRPSKVPWRQISRSSQVWLVMACYVLDGWANYTLLVCVPQYMNQVLKLPIGQNGLLSSVPYMAAFGFMFLITPLDSCMFTRNIMSTVTARKFWSSISSFGKCILLLVIAFLDESQKTTIIVLLVVNVMLSSCTLLGFNLADLDLAPPYAGLLFSIFNACSTFSGMLAPLVVGLFTASYEPELAWRNIFILASALSCFGGVIYVLFGHAGVLNWVAQEDVLLLCENDETVPISSFHSTARQISTF